MDVTVDVVAAESALAAAVDEVAPALFPDPDYFWGKKNRISSAIQKSVLVKFRIQTRQSGSNVLME